MWSFKEYFLSANLPSILFGLLVCAGLALFQPALYAAGPDTDLDGLEDSIDPDDDNDGMPDSFESQYFLNQLDPSDAILDADNDGYDNLSEYHAGTSPLDTNVNPGGPYLQHFKVVSADGNAADRFGFAVSVSGDTAIFGAQGDYSGTVGGSAYVYVQDGNGTWSQQAKLTTSDGHPFGGFGRSVSASGDIVVVGAPLDDENGANAGAAYVYTRDGNGVWTSQTKLLAGDGNVDDRFALSIAVSGDTALIGAYQDDDAGSDSGSVYVFKQGVGGAWSQQAKLVAGDAGKNTHFGRRVSLSGDTAVISANWALNNGEYTGAAYVFVRDGNGVWSQQAKLLASDGGGGNSFGESVSVSGDTVAVGADEDNDKGLFSGSVYVFVRDGNGIWSQQTKLKAGDGGSIDVFGNSVSVLAMCC